MANETTPNEHPDSSIIVESSDNPKDKQPEERIQQIMRRWDIHQSFWGPIHEEAREDDNFVKGDHWPAHILEKRKEAHRPALVYNLVPSFNRQIVNRVRQGRPGIRAAPVERDRSSKLPTVANMAGTKDYSLADVMTGIIKHTEAISRADQAYDTAVKHAADHGFGFFYLMNEWDPFDPFSQTLRVHRIKDSYSVTLDPEAQEADYNDAQDGFMYSRVRRATFEAKWPNIALDDFPRGVSDTGGWWDSDCIRVANYYFIEHKEDEVLKLSNGKTVFLSDVEDVLDDMEKESGVHVLREGGKEVRKSVRRPVCMWQKMTSKHILEGPIELPFSGVPIFIVTGEEIVVEGNTHYESAFRHAKDAQRSYNFWRTAAAETVALAPRAPWVLTKKQIQGHEGEWEKANEYNLPYLTYNHDDKAPPPQRQFANQAAAAELSNAVQDATDMQTIIGLHDASLGRESNEKSGRAIAERKAQGSTSTFQFPDNLNRSLARMGRMICEAAPQILDNERVQRIRLPDDTEDFVMLNTKVRDKQSGEDILVHDLGMVQYDVVMDTSGNDYQTQMKEAAELQMELLKVLGPDRAGNIVHLIVKNLGVPGSDEVYRILRKMLPDELKTDEERLEELPKGVTLNEQGQPVTEDGEPWQPPPTIEQQIAMKEQELKELEHKAEEAKHQATQAKAEADREKAKATLAQAQADMEQARAEVANLQAQGAAEQAPAVDMNEIREIISSVMKEHEEKETAHKVAIDEQVTDAVVEVLRRTKSYVDKQVAKLGRAPASPQLREQNRKGDT